MFVGAAADFGWLYYNQSRLQNAADAAVVAGANRLTADEQSLSDYTYTTFVSNNEKGLLKLIESDSRVKTRDSKAGDTIAIEYVKKNLSDNSSAEEGTDYDGTWNDTSKKEKSLSNLTIFKADSRNNNSDVNFQSRIYGVDSEDYESLYYTVVLSEKMPHLFSIMENLGFEPLNAQVMATAKIHHVMHGLDLYSQMVLKKIAETYADWDIIKQANDGSNSAADNRSVLTAGIYYKKFNHYRTELSILDGFSVSIGQLDSKYENNYKRNWASKKSGDTNDQTKYDDLFIDMVGEIYNGRGKNNVAFDNYDIDMEKKWNTAANSDGSKYRYVYGDRLTKEENEIDDDEQFEYRIHYPININAVYPLKKESLKEGDNPYHCLYAYIEREPVTRNGEYKMINKNNEEVTLKERYNMSAVRQFIINVNKSNWDAAKTRPVVIFYDGPEKGHSENKDENGKHLRDSQPVILNFYADFRGILFAPNSPVAINGNNHNFEGFVVAKEFVELMPESEYKAIRYETTPKYENDNENFYVKINDLSTTENSPEHAVLEINYKVQDPYGNGFNSKTGFVNKANLREKYDKYQYPYKVTSEGQTYYLNSLKNVKASEGDAKDFEVYLVDDEGNRLTDENGAELPPRYVPAGVIYYKVTEETVTYGDKKNVTAAGNQVTVDKSTGNTIITTKFKDDNGTENSFFVDDHGNVQYKKAITPNVELAENYRPDGIDDTTGQYTRPTEDGTFEQFNDDFTFVGNPFNLASKKI